MASEPTAQGDSAHGNRLLSVQYFGEPVYHVEAEPDIIGCLGDIHSRPNPARPSNLGSARRGLAQHYRPSGAKFDRPSLEPSTDWEPSRVSTVDTGYCSRTKDQERRDASAGVEGVASKSGHPANAFAVIATPENRVG